MQHRYSRFLSFLEGNNQFEATFLYLQHRTIDPVVDGTYTTSTSAEKEKVSWLLFGAKATRTSWFTTCAGKARSGSFIWRGWVERPRITDDVVRKVSRNHPFLDLDWSRLREEVNSRVELFDTRSPYVQNLMHSLRNLNLDLADLSPPMLLLADRANSSRELVTQLRLLRSTLDVKLDQFERSGTAQSGGRKKVPVGR